eukprot:1190728-Prorocentrum_minimum.AAC.1
MARIRGCVSLDGDADRLVYYTPTSSGLTLLDGDKIAALLAAYIADLLQRLPEGKLKQASVGVVQTAYANGASSAFLSGTLKLKTQVTPTGVRRARLPAVYCCTPSVYRCLPLFTAVYLLFTAVYLLFTAVYRCLPVAQVTPTGVKHLHKAAEHFDVGIYFEANGHGTAAYGLRADITGGRRPAARDTRERPRGTENVPRQQMRANRGA